MPANVAAATKTPTTGLMRKGCSFSSRARSRRRWDDPPRAGPPLIDHRAGIARQQQLPVRPPRGNAVGHDPLVELTQIEPGAARRLVVAAKLQRRHLSEEIAAVGRIVRPPHRLLARRRRREVRLPFEERRRLIHRPLLAVKPESHDHAADPRQRFTDLSETITGVVALEAFLDDQLLGIVRPAVLS